MDTKKILGYGHSLNVSSGQAKVQRGLMAHLAKKGHDVYYLGLQGKGTPVAIDKIVYPDGFEEKLYGVKQCGVDDSPWAHQAAATYTDIYKPDEVICISDIWNVPWQKREQRMKHTSFRYIHHVTYDTMNHISIWNQSLFEPNVPLNFSKYGKKICEGMGVKTEYIPHFVDTAVFKPVPESKKLELREKYRIPPDKFLYLTVGHNQIRKNFDRLLTAMSLIVRKTKDALLWFHCNPDGSAGGGWNLPLLAKDRKCDDFILYSDKAGKMTEDSLVSPMQLAEIYQIADAFVLPSAGGGFEIPMVEAQACGIPLITTAFCTGPEFCRGEAANNLFDYMGGQTFLEEKYGILVPFREVISHQQGGIWAVVDIEILANAMLHAKNSPDRLRSMGLLASEFVKKEYGTKKVFAKWDKLLASDIDYKPINAKLLQKDESEQLLKINPMQIKFNVS